MTKGPIMPKMTHWNSPDPVDVSPEKVAVYAAQGWVTVDEPARKVQPAIVRESAETAAPTTKAAKKAPAKKAVKKS